MLAAPPSRRDQLVVEAARMFAARGYHGVSLNDLGAAVGISGPAVYKHFASKESLLEEILVGISESLLAGARAVVAAHPEPADALEELLRAHTDFALSRPELISVQDRDLANLSPVAARKVRRLQRLYVEIWVDVLRARDPELDVAEARVRAHAVFGLLNSTPYVAHEVAAARRATVLHDMARAALA